MKVKIILGMILIAIIGVTGATVFTTYGKMINEVNFQTPIYIYENNMADPGNPANPGPIILTGNIGNINLDEAGSTGHYEGLFYIHNNWDTNVDVALDTEITPDSIGITPTYTLNGEEITDNTITLPPHSINTLEIDVEFLSNVIQGVYTLNVNVNAV